MNSNFGEGDIGLLVKELFDEVLDDGVQLHGVDYFVGQPLSSMWHATARVGHEFEKRRDAFLWILERLLLEGRLKLHKDGSFLETSIAEQIESFRHVWPSNEKPYPTHPDADFHLWFFDPTCPAGVAWRQADGVYLIAY
ncbi:DUF596 domain-containing protein [Hydrogenophaga sp.]|uniref:DUF596 domain-containing protein n=1 Tax=Hydrogenophaga sp. TaxID=1904254 RepID=UPI00271F99A0|nr:DUF596 domain-containing protein [Hydrogenophaga sp.]MDO9436646.1 DUF596 domain-containing protein [Hydrogenophaga sp.]